MKYEVVSIKIGHPRYEQIMGTVRNNEPLLDQMRHEADSELDEHPDAVFTVALNQFGQVAAWCALRTTGDASRRRCTNHYHFPVDRPNANDSFYAVVMHRQAAIIAGGWYCDAYLYPGAEGAMALAGWRPDWDNTGSTELPGMAPYHWRRWIWNPLTGGSAAL